MVMAIISQLTEAQPLYTISNYAKADSAYIISAGTEPTLVNHNFAQTGENYTWDYSDLEITTQRNYQFVSRDNSGYLLSFLASCLANGGNYFSCLSQWNSLSNLVKSQNEGVFLIEVELENYSEFLKTSSTKVEATMIGVKIKLDGNSVPITVKYSSSDVLMKLPLTYGSKDSSVSGFNANFNTLGYNLIAKRWQKRVNRIDGWGALQTPYGTFSQTIRLQTRIERIDSIIYEGDTMRIPTTEIQMQWWSPSHGQPVLTAVGTETEAGLVFASVSFIDSVRCLQPRLAFATYPLLPTIDASLGYVDVSFVNLSQNSTHYQWDFGDPLSGNQNFSTNKNPKHRYTRGGNYQVKLTARNEVCVTPPIAEITIPIMIADTADVSASFTIVPLAPAVNEPIQFTSQTQNAYAFFWDFGDGNVSMEQHPSHSFSTVGEFSVSFTASNTTKQANYAEVLNVSPATTVGELNHSKFEIYPNPTSGKCTIELPSSWQQGFTLKIISITGTVVYNLQKADKSTNQFEVDLSKLPAGIYTVFVRNHSETQRRMIVKR